MIDLIETFPFIRYSFVQTIVDCILATISLGAGRKDSATGSDVSLAHASFSLLSYVVVLVELFSDIDTCTAAARLGGIFHCECWTADSSTSC